MGSGIRYQIGKETQGTCGCDGKAQRGSGKEGHPGKSMEGLSSLLMDILVLTGMHCLQQGETVSQ